MALIIIQAESTLKNTLMKLLFVETLENEMIVHGDLTYGDGSGVFGFDCHHILSGDMSPADETMKLSDSKFNDLFSSPIDNPHYWTFDEVKEELTRLVQQFKARDIN